jgi:hypothetical protein
MSSIQNLKQSKIIIPLKAAIYSSDQRVASFISSIDNLSGHAHIIAIKEW